MNDLISDTWEMLDHSLWLEIKILYGLAFLVTFACLLTIPLGLDFLNTPTSVLLVAVFNLSVAYAYWHYHRKKRFFRSENALKIVTRSFLSPFSKGREELVNFDEISCAKFVLPRRSARGPEVMGERVIVVETPLRVTHISSRWLTRPAFKQICADLGLVSQSDSKGLYGEGKPKY